MKLGFVFSLVICFCITCFSQNIKATKYTGPSATAEQIAIIQAQEQAKVQEQLRRQIEYTTKYNRFWELYHMQDEQSLTQDQLVEFGGLGVWLAGNMTR